MQKDKRNILIFIVVLVIIVFASYFIFTSGTTTKIKGSVERLTATIDQDVNASDLPVINYVVNSSGENLVNTDVAITVNASSIYKINKVEYSFDLDNWQEVKEDINDKEVSVKIVFNKTINKKVYIRIINEKGYSSYAYETIVNIDKEKPTLDLEKNNENIVIKANDNVGLSSIQYSNDKENWEDEDISGEEITLTKSNFEYKYVRAVDSVGNISKIKEIDK